MSYLPTAITMLGPAALFTGAAALCLPRTVRTPTTATATATAERERAPLRANAILGPLLIAITLSVLLLTPGPFSQDPFLEILYLVGGVLAILTTLTALAALIGAAVYRTRTARTARRNRNRNH